MGSANNRRRYIVTHPLIGWAHTQNDRLLQQTGVHSDGSCAAEVGFNTPVCWWWPGDIVTAQSRKSLKGNSLTFWQGLDWILIHLHVMLSINIEPMDRWVVFQFQDSLVFHMYSNFKDKTVSWPPYPNDISSCADKLTSLYWVAPATNTD